jgi:hypothetical protein
LDKQVIDFTQSIAQAITAKAKAAGLSYPFIYLNDAAAEEDVFSSYGGGSSLPELRAIAKRYGGYIIDFKLHCLLVLTHYRSSWRLPTSSARWIQAILIGRNKKRLVCSLCRCIYLEPCLYLQCSIKRKC